MCGKLRVNFYFLLLSVPHVLIRIVFLMKRSLWVVYRHAAPTLGVVGCDLLLIKLHVSRLAAVVVFQNAMRLSVRIRRCVCFDHFYA